MTEIDKLWWRLDGATKSLARKKRLVAEESAYRKGKLPSWDLTDRAYPNVCVEKGATVDYTPSEASTAATGQLYGDLISPAEAEHRRLQAAYDALLEPRAASAGPVVRWGVATPGPPAPVENPIRRLLRSLYYTAF